MNYKKIFYAGVALMVLTMGMAVPFFRTNSVELMGYDVRTVYLNPCLNGEKMFCTNTDEVQFTIVLTNRIGD